MKGKSQRAKNGESQREGTMSTMLKSIALVIVLVVLMAVFVDVDNENIVLSLSWPILLPALLSASKELCVTLSKLVRMSH